MVLRRVLRTGFSEGGFGASAPCQRVRPSGGRDQPKWKTLFYRAVLFLLALFRSLCHKRQLSRKNKLDKLSGMFPALVFVAF